MITNANQILFRASSTSKIMGKIGLTENQENELNALSTKEKLTEKQREKLTSLLDKKSHPEMPQGIKTHLIDLYISSVFSRREEIDNKYLRKGNVCEEDSITLLSRVTKTLYNKNKTRKEDEYFSGEWDMNDLRLESTLDTKTSWNLRTFMNACYNDLNYDYYIQGQIYMHLTGAKKHTVAYCLVNSTAEIIDAEKGMLRYRSGMIDPSTGNESVEFKAKCRQIEINHIFDMGLFQSRYPYYSFHCEDWNFDIDKDLRVKLFEFNRDDQVIKSIIDRVELCREWMNKNLFNTDLKSLPQSRELEALTQ